MAVDALPGGQKCRQTALVGGLDLLAQGSEGGAPHATEHLHIAPLAAAPSRAKLAADDVPGALELTEDRARIDAVTIAKLLGREGKANPRTDLDQIFQAGHAVLVDLDTASTAAQFLDSSKKFPEMLFPKGGQRLNPGSVRQINSI